VLPPISLPFGFVTFFLTLPNGFWHIGGHRQ
jgi:hypothetical protein